MLEVRIYQVYNFKHVTKWLAARGSYLPQESEMPEFGAVAYDDAIPVAAGFIRRVEGNHGQLDGLVTDPDQPGELRSNAIDLVVEELMAMAKAMRIRSLVAFSADTNTLMRSLKHGFVQQPHTMIVADLTSGE